MAQTGYTAIQLYYTTTVSATPTAGNLAAGELAINTADEKLYFKNSSGVVKLLASTLMVGTNGGTGVNNGSRTISYAGNIAFTGAFNPTFAIPSSSTYTFPTGNSTLVATTGTVANATNAVNATNATNATSASTATAANGLKTATTTVSISAATAPTSGQVLTASSTTLAAWSTPSTALNNVTAASSTATLANGNNPIVWNWAQTTDSQVAFTFGESSAATGGSAAQDLVQISTIGSSTANPLRVKARGSDVLLVSNTGAVTVSSAGAVSLSGTSTSISCTANYSGAVTIAAGSSASTGGAVSLTAGASSGGTGGAVTITTGNGGSVSGSQSGDLTISTGSSSAYKVGDITIRTPTAPSGSYGIAGNIGILSSDISSPSTGGSISLTAGDQNGSFVNSNAGGGSVSITAGNSANTYSGSTGGSVNITAGNSTSNIGGDIVLTTGTGSENGKINFVHCNVANGTVATTITSLGPTGASTTIVGWLAIKVNGTARYVPYW